MKSGKDALNLPKISPYIFESPRTHREFYTAFKLAYAFYCIVRSFLFCFSCTIVFGAGAFLYHQLVSGRWNSAGHIYKRPGCLQSGY